LIIAADAICDRIVHDSYRIVIECEESMRKKFGVAIDGKMFMRERYGVQNSEEAFAYE